MERKPSLPDHIMTISYRIFSDECMVDFKSSLQKLNWLIVLNAWDTLCSSEGMTGVIQHLPLLATEKVECRAGMTGNMPGGLFVRAAINFSMSTRVMISLLAIY